MTIVKTSVIVMGILLVLGLAFLGYRVSNQPGALVAAALNPDKALLVRLGLPADSKILSVATSDKTLTLHLAIPGQGQWIYVIPLAGDGRMLKIAVSDTGGTRP